MLEHGFSTSEFDVPLTLLCIATYRKGDEFLNECHRQGCRVLLLTEEKLSDSDWPRDAIDDFYFVRRDMPDETSARARRTWRAHERIDRIVALDDFDVEMAAMLREYLHVPGMGETTARALSRQAGDAPRARAARHSVPGVRARAQRRAIAEWTARVPPPWVLKPRSARRPRSASASSARPTSCGARSTRSATRAPITCSSSSFPATSFTSTRLSSTARCVFAVASAYGTPPMAVAHDGGIFVTRTLPADDPRRARARALNARVLKSFGLCAACRTPSSSARTTARWYFLETSARVGGAFIVDVVEAATEMNLWREWASDRNRRRTWHLRRAAARMRSRRHRAVARAAGIAGHAPPTRIRRSSRRIRKSHHAGLIVASPRTRAACRTTARFLRHQVLPGLPHSAPAPERAPTDTLFLSVSASSGKRHGDALGVADGRPGSVAGIGVARLRRAAPAGASCSGAPPIARMREKDSRRCPFSSSSCLTFSSHSCSAFERGVLSVSMGSFPAAGRCAKDSPGSGTTN